MSPWTDDRIDMLRGLWADGLSASEIAKFFGHGMTRNAIIGKAHRLKLEARKMGAKRLTGADRSVKRQTVKVPAPAAVKTPPPVPWTGPSINILDDNLRQFMCREIVAGSGVHTMFCGAPTVPGSQFSYCAFHALKNVRLAKRKDSKPRFVPYGVAA